MVAEHEAWLKTTIEEPIDPGLPICDPHHHLWDRSARQDRPGNRYLLEELLEDTGGGHSDESIHHLLNIWKFKPLE